LHEFSLMQEVVAAILAELKKRGESAAHPGLEVELHLGALEMHSQAAARQAYEVLVQNTDLAGSRLTLVVAPVTLSCPNCGFAGPLPEGQVDPHEVSPLAECPVCGKVSPVQGGRGVGPIRLVFPGQAGSEEEAS